MAVDQRVHCVRAIRTATVRMQHARWRRMMDVPIPRDPTAEITWPEGGVSRVPFRLFSDPAIYAEEQKRLFRGPIWNFLCLEIEIPTAGDWRLATVGEVPVVVTRDEN